LAIIFRYDTRYDVLEALCDHAKYSVSVREGGLGSGYVKGSLIASSGGISVMD
jgi:hypothetical protein